MNDLFNSSRRHFLGANLFGLSGIAASWLMRQEDAHSAGKTPNKPLLEHQSFDLKPKEPPYPPRADAMISIFMDGTCTNVSTRSYPRLAVVPISLPRHW